MADSASHTHHAIDYIELSAPDLAAAKAFYGSAFGWEFNDYGPEYAGIRGTEREQGGIAKGEPKGQGGPLVILYSENLEATLKAVTAAGGTISVPPFEFPGGRRFHFTDPGGNELGVWSET
ncbi:MAG: VOC family protein [Nannocystaceae bacterium]|nr:VOC family protein [Nannocystaceae bacterium]